MVVRRESVRIDISGNYAAELGALAGGIALVNREVDRLNGQTIHIRTSASGDLRRLTGDLQRADRQMQRTSSSASRMDSQLNTTAGRVGLLGEALVSLGPAAIPIAAVAVPAITGLGNQLGFAAAAAGTAVLAFHGIGDALKAANDAAIDPSVANLQRVRESMRAIGPDGRGLVETLRGLSDEGRRLQMASRAGFPGLSHALEQLSDLTPDAARILRQVSLTLGDIAQAGAADLTSGRWAEFFTFLEREAKPTLTELAAATGNVVHAMAELWMATQPMNASFSRWLVDATRDMDRWASGLSKTDGFHDFLDYIHQSGPQVAATVGAVANALLQVVQAAAPIGGPVLHVLEQVANVVAGLADSDIGGPLIAGTAALLAFNRALAVTETLGKANLLSRIAPQVAALGSLTTQSERAAASTEDLGDTVESLADKPMVRGAVGLGSMALASSELGNTTLGTTAAMAGMGFMIGGPYGAAIGAGVGLVTSLAKASKNAASAQDDLAASMAGTNFAQFRADLDKAVQAQKAFTAEQASGRVDMIDVNPALDKVVAQGQAVNLALTQLAVGLGAKSTLGEYGRLMGQTQVSIVDLQKAAALAAPALEHFGLSFDDLGEMDPTTLRETVKEVRAYMAASGQGAAASSMFGGSLRSLALDAVSAAGSATALSAAIASYASPALDAEEATDAWHASLTGLKKTLNDKAGFTGWSQAAVANRDATREYATAVQEMLTTQAENGAGEQRIAKLLAASRREFIANGIAAGFDRKEMIKRANAIGLTPKLARTVFETAGVDVGQRKVREFKADLRSLPAKVRTDIAANGIPKSKADVEALQKKYDLTPAQVKTLMKLEGVAAAIGDTQRVQRAINAVSGKTVTVTTVMRTVYTNAASNSGNAPQNRKADGGRMVGPGTGTSDSIPALLSDGEWVIRAAAVAKYGDGLLSDINAMRFASGGRVPSDRRGNSPMAKADKQFNLTAGLDVAGVQSELDEFERAMRKLGRHLGKGFDQMSAAAIENAKSLQALRTHLDDVKSRMSEVRSGAAGSFNHDVFGGTYQDFLTGTAADRNDAAAATKALAKAAKSGLDGPLAAALAQSGNLALQQEFANKNAAQIAAAEKLYGSRTAQQSLLGQKAVDVSGLEQEQKRTTAQMAQVAKAVDRLEQRIENGVARGAEKGTRAGNDDKKRRDTARAGTRAATGRR